MKYLYKEVGIRDLSFNASEPLNLQGALRKPQSDLRGVVPSASGPPAAVFILQTHPNGMDWHDPTAPVVLSSAAQYGPGPRSFERRYSVNGETI